MATLNLQKKFDEEYEKVFSLNKKLDWLFSLSNENYKYDINKENKKNITLPEVCYEFEDIIPLKFLWGLYKVEILNSPYMTTQIENLACGNFDFWFEQHLEEAKIELRVIVKNEEIEVKKICGYDPFVSLVHIFKTY